MSGPTGLGAHARADTRGVHPHLLALGQHDAVEEHGEFPLGGLGFIHELREEQVWRDRDATASHCGSAHAAGQANVGLGITRERAADVGQGQVSELGALLTLEHLKDGRVRTPRGIQARDRRVCGVHSAPRAQSEAADPAHA